MVSGNEPQKRKARRIARACDYCHQRGIRCRPSDEKTGCQNCKDFDQACTYQRQIKKRGVPARLHSQNNTPDGPEAATETPQINTDTSHPVRPENDVRSHDDNSSGTWSAPHIASQTAIMDLVELYFEIVYPIFPFFHQPSFMRAVSRAEYARSRNLFAATMAVCALTSARVRDGAVTNPKWDVNTLQETPHDVFYAEAARQAVLSRTADLNLMRANAILAITAIQNGNTRDMHLYMGRYQTIVAMDGLHDETNWPEEIGLIEVEERRRLFWSIYTLDIYTSVVWGGIFRCREQQSAVAYPTEIDDDMFDNNGVSSQALIARAGQGPSPGRHGLQVSSTSWLSGWNYITDMYRVLEHALTSFRDRRMRSRSKSWLHDIFDSNPTFSQSSIHDHVMQMYRDLPQCFKETNPITFDSRLDRFGFQAANITATLQLLRMFLFSASGASVTDRCQVASEVVNAFMAVPVAYHQAISAPLLHHIGSIGDILGSVLGEPLTLADYACVRSTLLTMAQLLANLDHVKSGTGAAERLRAQVAKIDEFMVTQHRDQHHRRHRLSTSDRPSNEFARLSESYSTYDALSTGINGTGLSPFQLPPEVVGNFNWLFDFTHAGEDQALV